MKLYFLCGEQKPFRDGEALLYHVLDSYSIDRSQLVDEQIHYGYTRTPPSRELDRENIRARRMVQLRNRIERDDPFLIIGFGWLACDLLFQVGKSRTKTRVGAKWPIIPELREESGGGSKMAWLAYDPIAALYDPNLIVDISWVIVEAAERDAGIKTKINTSIPPFNWSAYL